MKVRNKLVFIVEDSELYSMMLDYTLSNDISIKFMRFKTGEECLQNLHLDPMVILLDYWLPGINGMDTFKEIKKNDPEIPVIILTNDKDLELASKLLIEGVSDYFNKDDESINEIKEIINVEFNKILESEENQMRKMRRTASVLFLIAVIIVIIYAKRFG
jgi:DNA-binding NtrC family response regulator